MSRDDDDDVSRIGWLGNWGIIGDMQGGQIRKAKNENRSLDFLLLLQMFFGVTQG
jgi:hypothetical protein